MGRTVVKARIESLRDLYEVQKGLRKRAEARIVEVGDALVDTGSTMLSLPKRLIKKLGLRKVRTRRIRTATGEAETDVYDAVRLTVQGRDCTIDVAEVAEGCPVLIGQISLEMMDFVVDPRGQKLMGNPAHGGEHVY
jgi:clan AA aspartic protease